MNNVKSKKILIILINSILICFILSTTVLGDLIGDFDNSITTSGSGTTDLKDAGEIILGYIRVIGIIVAVGMLMIIGIKYILGSAEEKAEYKKTLFPYFIGAILIFAATNLADMIYSWVKGI